MSNQDLLTSLQIYNRTWASRNFSGATWNTNDELAKTERFHNFVSANAACFQRSHLPGHFTGSALVVNPSLTKVLLTHHRKLGVWLQLGGHADGHPLLDEVAMREAIEESGLQDLSFLNYEAGVFALTPLRPVPFDLDAHEIPANSRDPHHQHFDVRFVIVGNDQEKPIVSEESHDVRWFTLAEARATTQELSMHRQFDKIDLLRRTLGIDL